MSWISTLLSLLRSPGRAGLGAAKDLYIRKPIRAKAMAKITSWGREKLLVFSLCTSWIYGIGPGKCEGETSPQCTPALIQRSTKASKVGWSQALKKSACRVSPEFIAER